LVSNSLEPAVPSNRSRLLSLLMTAVAYLALKALLYRASELFDLGDASAWYPPIGLSLAFVLHSGWMAIPFVFVPSDLLAYPALSSSSPCATRCRRSHHGR
jgi:hypothetical protein